MVVSCFSSVIEVGSKCNIYKNLTKTLLTMFQTNTFQLVLTTDQVQTIALYIYGVMEWTGNEFNEGPSSQVC